MAGGGFFSRFGRTIIAQQDGTGIGLLFYKPQPFENFILRLDFLLPHPRGNNNDNSGVFVRFRDPRLPDPAPDPVDPPNNAAFVAVHTGFEIQIDEEARGDTRFGEPDGSFFCQHRGHLQNQNAGNGRRAAGLSRTILTLAARAMAPLRNRGEQSGLHRPTQWPGSNPVPPQCYDDTVRGNPPSVDPNSGFIGLQTHTGNVAFANVRIKTM